MWIFLAKSTTNHVDSVRPNGQSPVNQRLTILVIETGLLFR